MPVTLNIPPGDGGRLRLRLGSRLVVCGPAARRRAMREMEMQGRNLEGMMHAVVICTLLWSGFWIQFVVSVFFNMPALYTLSGGYWYAPQVEFYIAAHSPLLISVAESFSRLSVFGAILALIGVWHWTRGVVGRWRMRAAVAGFAGFLVLWSFAALVAEDAAWLHLDNERAELIREIAQEQDENWRFWLKSKLDRIEEVSKLREP